ncbi:MAG: hypothetical protein M3137_00035 [Actinomycetota bacterium]|nr:hypothetical protein [Actinomycetota bacterium]
MNGAADRAFGQPAVRRAAWATIAVLAVTAAAAMMGPGGGRHRGDGAMTLRSSAGVVVAADGSRPGARTGSRDAEPGGLTPRSVPLAGPGTATAPSTLRHLPPLPKPKGALPSVAALSAIRPVDAIVTLPTTITPTQVAALIRLPGLSAVEEVDTGTVTLSGTSAVTLGVDPGTFRQFTPKVTASEDELWRYVAGGALASSYQAAASRSLLLGNEVTITPAGGSLAPTTAWLGALASLGLPGVDLVVSHAYSDRLGLVPDSGLVVSAPKMDPHALLAGLTSLLPGADVELLQPTAGASAPPQSGL